MTKLAYLHEPGVLQNLRCRYDINEIYVSIYLLIFMNFPNLCLHPFSWAFSLTHSLSCHSVCAYKHVKWNLYRVVICWFIWTAQFPPLLSSLSLSLSHLSWYRWPIMKWTGVNYFYVAFLILHALVAFPISLFCHCFISVAGNLCFNCCICWMC